MVGRGLLKHLYRPLGVPTPTAKELSERPLWAIREGTPADYGFVVSSWLEANRDAPMGGRYSGASTYRREHRRLIEIALRRSTLRIAHVLGAPTALVGWAAYEEPTRIVHYVYVRRDMRRLGMATALLEPFGKAPAIMTHKVCDTTWFRSKQKGDPQDPETGHFLASFPEPASWQFNPYVFFTHMTEDPDAQD
jgi:GNAT superfamily N-acetyltransferase